MKVLKHISFIIGELTNGGQEKQLYFLIRELLKKDYPISVIVWNYDEVQRHAQNFLSFNIPVLLLNKESSIEKIKRCRLFLMDQHALILHSYSFHLNAITWAVTLGLPVTAIGALRSMPTHNIESIGWLLALPNFILPLHLISNNHNGATVLSRWIPIKKIYVVENGIDTSEIKDGHTNLSSSFSSISIGRLYHVKRIDKLIEIISGLVQNGVPVYHSHWGAGPLRDELQQKIDNLSLGQHFIFKGETTDVASEIAKADLFLHTSIVEGTPNVILEAMLQGKPVVTSNCGDVNQIITQDKDGFICYSDSNAEFIEKISGLLNSEALRKSVGEAARQKIIEQYSLESYMNKTIQAYTSIISE